jgi:putative tryptophan/tyrosine transport system substrate-binding protein
MRRRDDIPRFPGAVQREVVRCRPGIVINSGPAKFSDQRCATPLTLRGAPHPGNMRRRDFITLFGGAAASWPLSARAQAPAMPVLGFLGTGSPEVYATRLRVFHEGLKEAGYVEGENVAIEYRWANGQNDLLPKLAAELVQLRVAVIVAASGTLGAMAAKAATTTIPIVFGVAVDPVEAGLVASLNRPGGNLTGVTNLNVEIGPKRLELLHTLLPTATAFAVLVDPTGVVLVNDFTRSLETAARTLGLQLHVLNASADRDFDSVFASLAQLHASALIIGPSALFSARSERLGALAARHKVPAIGLWPEFAAGGGLLSYGSDETEYYRLVGIYTGRILKGEKPAELPVQESAKVKLIVNLKTAKALGITVPLSLLGRADEVIE